MKLLTKILVILFLTFTFAYSQTVNDSLKLLTSTDWRVSGDWFGSNNVLLIPIKPTSKLDTTGLSEKEKLIAYAIWRESTGWGETIHFDSQGNLMYKYSIYCPVGEYLYDVKTFKLSGKNIFVEFKKYLWDTKEEQEYTKAYYSIEKWTPEKIELNKIW